MKKNRGNAKILIVEDSTTNILLLQGILENEDYSDILIANSGKEAFKIMEKNAVDLILLDIMLPEMNGIEILKILKSNEKTKSIPVIVNSAYDSAEIIKEVNDLQALLFLSKPLNIRLFIETINTLFS